MWEHSNMCDHDSNPVPCGFTFPTHSCAAGDVRAGKEMAWKQSNWEVVRSCVIVIGRGEQSKTREMKGKAASTPAAGIHLSILPWSWGSIPLPYSGFILKVTQRLSGIRKKCPLFLCLSELTPIGLLFTTHCIGDLVSLCRSLWWQKWGDSPGAPVIPMLVPDLTRLFTPESVTSVLSGVHICWRGCLCQEALLLILKAKLCSLCHTVWMLFSLNCLRIMKVSISCLDLCCFRRLTVSCFLVLLCPITHVPWQQIWWVPA